MAPREVRVRRLTPPVEAGVHGMGRKPQKGEEHIGAPPRVQKLFARLSVLDRIMLDTSRVMLFIKSVDAQDWEKVGPLLETEDELTTTGPW